MFKHAVDAVTEREINGWIVGEPGSPTFVFLVKNGRQILRRKRRPSRGM